MRSSFPRGLVVCAWLAMLLPLRLQAESPSGWRGDGSGRFPDARPVAVWSAEKNVLWKTDLPGGSPACPILVEDRLLVASDPARLICLRASDGKPLWEKGHDRSELPANVAGMVAGDLPLYNPDGEAGSAAATPVSDGKQVIAAFANGVVSSHALDGTRQWVRFVERPQTDFGHASSPVLAAGKVIIHFVDLVALDAATGEEAWRLKLPATHATPLATRIGDVEVLVHPRGAIVRATDGKVLAQDLFQLDRASPVIAGGVLYAHENGQIKALRLPIRSSDTLEPKLLWTADATRSQYQISSAAIHAGRLFGVNMNGILQATDCESGAVIYRQRLPVDGRVYCSVTLAGEQLLIADQLGKTLVLAPDDRYRQLAANQLDIHPSGIVCAGERMYLRTWRHLYCIGSR